MKKRKILKKGLAVVLSSALVTGVLPEIHRVDAFAQTVVATMPGITAYATAEQLKDANNFTLHTDNGSGIAQKVNFGTRQGGSQTWYIAGYDESTSGLVMICNPEAEMSIVDFSNQLDNITSDIQGQYEGETPTEGGANHYGNSALRERLGTLVNDCFTAKEQTLMLNPTVYTYDTLNTTTYSTSDKLYAPYGEAGNTYITVGSNSPENLTAGIKVGITSENAPSGSLFSKEIGEEVIDGMGMVYFIPYEMPLRTPANVDNASVQYYITAENVMSANVRITLYVVPAFHLNMDMVLFGSAAAAGTVDATISDSMTLRYDGSSMIESEANSCSQDMIRVTKGTQDDEYLYIQWEDDGSNQVYVTQITEDFALSAETVGVDSFENCKVWLETVYDGVAFAKEMSNEHELPDTFDANGFK